MDSLVIGYHREAYCEGITSWGRALRVQVLSEFAG